MHAECPNQQWRYVDDEYTEERQKTVVVSWGRDVMQCWRCGGNFILEKLLPCYVRVGWTLLTLNTWHHTNNTYHRLDLQSLVSYIATCWTLYSIMSKGSIPRTSALAIDEAALLNKYRISSLSPKWGSGHSNGWWCLTHSLPNVLSFPIFTSILYQLYRHWEDIDHELTGSIAGSLSTGAAASTVDEDPLGLGHRIEYVTWHVAGATLTVQ